MSMGDSWRGRMSQPWRLWQGKACLPPLGPPYSRASSHSGHRVQRPFPDLTCCLKSPHPGGLPSRHTHGFRGTRGTTGGKQFWAITLGTGPENMSAVSIFSNEEMKEQRDQVTSFELLYESNVEMRKVSSSQLFS